MSHESYIRHCRHCVYRLHVHWVFVAKYRRRVFDARAIDVLRGIFADVCSDMQATLVEMDGEDDHVHLLLEYPPKVPVSVLVNSLKGVSSRLLRRAFWSISIVWSIQCAAATALSPTRYPTLAHRPAGFAPRHCRPRAR